MRPSQIHLHEQIPAAQIPASTSIVFVAHRFFTSLSSLARVSGGERVYLLLYHVPMGSSSSSLLACSFLFLLLCYKSVTWTQESPAQRTLALVPVGPHYLLKQGVGP